MNQLSVIIWKPEELGSSSKEKPSEAYASFRNDEVWRKASLSSKHSGKEILEKAGRRQSDLTDF